MENPPFPILETNRLSIRMAQAHDAHAVLKYYIANQQHLAPYEPSRDEAFYTLSHWESEIQKYQDEFQADRALRVFLFPKSAPDTVVGVVGFSNLIRGAFQACYLGYSVSLDVQGQGIASEALRTLIAFVFRELRMHRIMANYMPRNERSAVLLRRLGFVIEGTARNYLKIDGQWEDHVLTALTAPED
jgi:[ribosomal protein S5]-alanine N-acetyltransferase